MRVCIIVDFVEIHAANGYLIDQFMQSCTNQRTDEYGGSVENRLRFMREVVDAVLEHVPVHQVGIRFSPNGSYGGMGSSDGIETFNEAIKFVASRKLAYLHVLDGLGFGFHNLHTAFTLAQVRSILQEGGAGGELALIGNVGYDKEGASKQIEDGNADLIAFGRPFLNCPDFGNRIRDGGEIPPELPRELWFAGGEHGYTDCPIKSS
jgi:N-ethylmaleimide reductase